MSEAVRRSAPTASKNAGYKLGYNSVESGVREKSTPE